MIQISAATRIGIIALLIGMAALFFAALDTPQATEAATWGAGSCVDPDDCDNLAPGTVIGENSCNSTTDDACDNLNGTVGDNSCLGARVCEESGDNGGIVKIGDDSCHSLAGDLACADAGADGGSFEVGDGSCLGDDACLRAGTNVGSATIEDDSCIGDRACENAGADGGEVMIGDDSCNGDGGVQACFEAGNQGEAQIGDESCNGEFACYETGLAGFSVIGNGSCNFFSTTGSGACEDSGDDTGSSIIGENSCNDSEACSEAGEDGGESQIGDDSCDGEFACLDVGSSGGLSIIGNNSCNLSGTVLISACENSGIKGSSIIGNGSCNGSDEACKDTGRNGSGDIGRYSCNTALTDCFQNQSTIGDCLFNNVDPPPCVSIDFGVTKTALATSLPPGGANVTFEVEVENSDPFAIELTSLVDDVFGNLDGLGSCSTPQTIARGDSYTCSFTAFVDADHENTVEADATDEVGNSGTREDDASVAVAIAEPTPTATARPSLGGALGAVVVGGAQQARENRAAAAQQSISPPSTGDAGLAAD